MSKSGVNIELTTVPIIESLPRLQVLIKASTGERSHNDPRRSYYSDGITRATEMACIIQYTLEGCGDTWIRERHFPVPLHSAMLNIINRVDTGYRYPEGGTETWKFITFSFSGGNVREVFKELIARYGPVFDLSAAHEQLLAMAASIERRGSRIYSTQETNSMYNRLIAILLESVRGDSERYNQTIDDVHAIVEREIKSSESIRFGVNEIAGELGISREYLSKLYRGCTGQTLKAYIDRRRIDYICELLFVRGLNCAEAARAIGIDYPANLTTYFRRCTGFTPTQYRIIAASTLHTDELTISKKRR